MPTHSLPYPPSPEEVDDDLTRPTSTFLWQATLLLLCLFVFLLVYVAFVALAVYGIRICLTRSLPWLVRFPALILAGFLVLFLLKGLFSRRPTDKTFHVEITEEEHPQLFEFIERLCEEVGARMPHRVFVSPEVNAAVLYELSVLNLVVPPRKNLLIGLGLVNVLNLSEFKAVMAHEFGHFRQRSFLTSYTYVATRIISEMVAGRDWFDELITKMKRSENLSAIGWALHGVIWGVRKTMTGLLYAILFLRSAVSRQREFNADLVAVSVAGSDAVVHGLLRSDFAYVALNQALEELRHAADHHIYTADLFFHHNHAASTIRKQRKDPHWGEPPRLKGPYDGEDVQVFPDAEDDQNDVPPMWRSHPSNHDREENAKESFVPCPIDHRSPWVLFGEVEELRERVAYRYYRVAYRVTKDVELSEPERVQRFLDEERQAVTYDPKYHGCYDERSVEPGDLKELQEQVSREVWEDDRIERVHGRLYAELGDRAEVYNRQRKEYMTVLRQCNFRPKKRARRVLGELDSALGQAREWFRSFDRRVYLVHAYMARRVDHGLAAELQSRYRFHLELQKLHGTLAQAQDRVGAVLNELNGMGDRGLSQDFVLELVHVLRTGRAALAQILGKIRALEVPAMANVRANADLSRFLLEDRLLPEMPSYSVTGQWINRLVHQMAEVRSKMIRLDFKSLGAILKLQDQIAEAWHECRAGKRPFAAAVEEADREIFLEKEGEEEGGVYGVKDE